MSIMNFSSVTTTSADAPLALRVFAHFLRFFIIRIMASSKWKVHANYTHYTHLYAQMFAHAIARNRTQPNAL